MMRIEARIIFLTYSHLFSMKTSTASDQNKSSHNYNLFLQILDLETKYLEQSSAFGNAVRGYEGFLGGLSQANRKIVIKPEERLFSMSSSSSVPH